MIRLKIYELAALCPMRVQKNDICIKKKGLQKLKTEIINYALATLYSLIAVLKDKILISACQRKNKDVSGETWTGVWWQSKKAGGEEK